MIGTSLSASKNSFVNLLALVTLNVSLVEPSETTTSLLRPTMDFLKPFPSSVQWPVNSAQGNGRREGQLYFRQAFAAGETSAGFDKSSSEHSKSFALSSSNQIIVRALIRKKSTH